MRILAASLAPMGAICKPGFGPRNVSGKNMAVHRLSKLGCNFFVWRPGAGDTTRGWLTLRVMLSAMISTVMGKRHGYTIGAIFSN